MVRLLKRLSAPAKDWPDPAVEATEEGRLCGVRRVKSLSERLNVGRLLRASTLTLVAAPVRCEFISSLLDATTSTSPSVVVLTPTVMFRRRDWPKLKNRPPSSSLPTPEVTSTR